MGFRDQGFGIRVYGFGMRITPSGRGSFRSPNKDRGLRAENLGLRGLVGKSFGDLS